MGLLTDLLGDGNGTSAAAIVGKFTGTPDGTQFLRDDGTLAAPAGGTSSIDQGTLAARPTAAAAGDGALYWATDDNGGTLYLSNGSTWSQAAPGVSQGSSGRIWLPVGEARANPNVDINVITAYAVGGKFDAVSIEGLVWSTFLPTDWSTFDITIYWANFASGAGNVVWRVQHIFAGAGEHIGTGATVSANTTAAAGAEDITVVTQLQAGASAITTEPLYLLLQRMANDGADTLANDAAVMGMLLTKAL